MKYKSYTKQEIAQECHKKAYGYYYQNPNEISEGGTVTKEILDLIARKYNISTDGGKGETARRLSEHFNFAWIQSYHSENTASGGDGTVTKEFYEELYNHL